MSLANGGFVLGTNYWEDAKSGSNSISIQGDNQTVTRVFRVKSADVPTFIRYCLGFAQTQSSGSVYNIHRELPEQHPSFPSMWAMEVSSAKGEGFVWSTPTAATMQDGNHVIAYNEYKLEVVYRSVDFDILTDGAVSNELYRYVSRHYTFSAEYLTYWGVMKYCTSPNQLMGGQPGKISCNIEKTLTWQMVPENPSDPYNVPNYANVKNCVGRTNNATFDGDVKGTVLFLGVDPQRTRPNIIDQQIYWTVGMKFGIKNNGSAIGTDSTDGAAGWNYIYDPYASTPLWDLVTGAKTPFAAGSVSGQRLYDQADFSTLFKLPV